MIFLIVTASVFAVALCFMVVLVALTAGINNARPALSDYGFAVAVALLVALVGGGLIEIVRQLALMAWGLL